MLGGYGADHQEAGIFRMTTPETLRGGWSSQKCVDPPTARQQTASGCNWTERLVRSEHGIPAFFRRGCKAAPSPTPGPSSSIPPEEAWLTGQTLSKSLTRCDRRAGLAVIRLQSPRRLRITESKCSSSRHRSVSVRRCKNRHFLKATIDHKASTIPGNVMKPW